MHGGTVTGMAMTSPNILSTNSSQKLVTAYQQYGSLCI